MGIDVEVSVDTVGDENGILLLCSPDGKVITIRMSGSNVSLSKEVRVEDLRLALRKLTAK